MASFFGDGATEEGVFAESLNFAVLKQLPILFVCENNGYAIHTHQSRRQGSTDICDRARGLRHARRSASTDNDVIGLMQRHRWRSRRIRARRGARTSLRCMTYRWREHVGPGEDYHLGYRTEDEAEPWIDNDPGTRLGEHARRRLSAQQIEAEVEAGSRRRRSPSPKRVPSPRPRNCYTDIFKED